MHSVATCPLHDRRRVLNALIRVQFNVTDTHFSVPSAFRAYSLPQSAFGVTIGNVTNRVCAGN